MLLAGATGLVSGAALIGAPVGMLLRRTIVRLRELDQTLTAVRYDAEHDGLTGLANRTTFYAHAAVAAATNPPGSSMAVAVIDIDDFKQVNDALGHGVGDLVLHALARRLHKRVGPGGLVARLGGDEFAAIVPLGEGESPKGLGTALCLVGETPADVDLDRVDVVPLTVSVGVAPADGPADLVELLTRADAAMYRAKRQGLGVAVYDPAHDAKRATISGAWPELRTRDETTGTIGIADTLVAVNGAVIA